MANVWRSTSASTVASRLPSFQAPAYGRAVTAARAPAARTIHPRPNRGINRPWAGVRGPWDSGDRWIARVPPVPGVPWYGRHLLPGVPLHLGQLEQVVWLEHGVVQLGRQLRVLPDVVQVRLDLGLLHPGEPEEHRLPHVAIPSSRNFSMFALFPYL